MNIDEPKRKEVENMDQQQNTCMACSCPCEMHKEHTHATGQTQNQSELKCPMCGASFNSKEEMDQHAKEKHNQ